MSPPSATSPSYAYKVWSHPLVAGLCSNDTVPLEIPIMPSTGSAKGVIVCTLKDGVKSYKFPPGIFEIDEQLLILERTSITGAMNPNNMANPKESPDWKKQTLFLATRGVTDYNMNYCHARNIVSTRVGFVLSSHVMVSNISYQGVDTIRPNDNGALCGGGVFETKGCAENDCSSNENNGGSDGIGSSHVIIENVRLNDFYYEQDRVMVGASIPGNYNCTTGHFSEECCFCKPNAIRSSQVGVWVPQTRNVEGTHHISVSNVISSSTQADGINLHGHVHDVSVQNTYFQNTGDDVYAVWAGSLVLENVEFKNCIAVNPGILRPKWYGNCVATYGLKNVVFENVSCWAPTLKDPIRQPGSSAVQIDTSMFVFYTSFGGSYPAGNNVTIKDWAFQDLDGSMYMPKNGSMGIYEPGKMVWTESQNGPVAPYYLPDKAQEVNVHILQRIPSARIKPGSLHGGILYT